MTNPPPSNPQPSRREWDELIAVVVALGAIGTILFWGLSRRPNGWALFTEAPQTAPTPTATLTPLPARSPGERPNNITPLPGSGIPLLPSAPVQTTPTAPAPTVPNVSAAPTAPAVVVPAPTVPTPATPVAPTVTPAAPVPPTAVTPVAPPVTTPAIAFSDVPADYWAAPFIAALAQRGGVIGTAGNQFEPERSATRAEYAIELQKLYPLSNTQSPLSFTDVPADAPALSGIDAAVRGGFLKGYPEGNFAPNQPMPRYQLYLSLANGLKLPIPANPEQILAQYSDSSQLPRYALGPIAAATQAGLVIRNPNTKLLEPTRPVTRAEMVASVHQALVSTGQLPAIESPYIAR